MILFMRGGACVAGEACMAWGVCSRGHAWQEGRVWQGGHAWQGACVTHMPPRQILRLRHTVNERAVRILLECILVSANCTEICALWKEVYLTILFWKCLWFLENVMKYLVNYHF